MLAYLCLLNHQSFQTTDSCEPPDGIKYSSVCVPQLSLGQSHFSFKHQKEKCSLVLLAKQVHSAPCSGDVFVCSCMRRGNGISHVPERRFEFSGKER